MAQNNIFIELKYIKFQNLLHVVTIFRYSEAW